MPEYKDMETSALEARKAELAELATTGAEERSLEELNAFAKEMKAINAEIEARKNAEAERRAKAEAIIKGAGEVITEAPEKREENNKMEIRNSKEYIDAFAEYIKTGKDDECRALLTTNATGEGITGTVAVPDMVYDIVKTAWEKNEIIARVAKTEIKGNLKVNFEVSASAAGIHAEGTDEIAEEELILGIVQLVPANIKKWKGVSDEALDMRGEAFLRYVYDEVTYKIMKAASDNLVTAIVNSPATSSATAPAVPVDTTTDAIGAVLAGRALLSDEADESAVVILNRTTWAAIEKARLAANYAFDPFYGLPVIMNSSVPANTVIVGSLERGALANFPAGYEVKLNFDDKTLATKDINRIIGRMYVAVGVVAPNAFAKVTISA